MAAEEIATRSIRHSIGRIFYANINKTRPQSSATDVVAFSLANSAREWHP